MQHVQPGSSALRALGWDHPRCVAPMRRCAGVWKEEAGIDVGWVWGGLGAVGDQALGGVAAGDDLLVLDPPLCGTPAQSGRLAPLGGLGPASPPAGAAARST